MSRIWFATPLETVATFWRILRRDGVALGFVTHDRDLWLDGVLHRAAPGMVPSAIRRSAGLEPDSAEVEGVLSHDALSAADIAQGRLDGAAMLIGLVDWQSGERDLLYSGRLGRITAAGTGFQAVISSCKADLLRNSVPATSPTCRARFCGPGCGLSSRAWSGRGEIAGCDLASSTVTLAQDVALPGLVTMADWTGGRLRWLDGPLAGTSCPIHAASGRTLVLGAPLDLAVPPGVAVRLRQGCDRTLATCAGRFGNAINFRGEPMLPGNDLIARTPAA